MENQNEVLFFITIFALLAMLVVLGSVVIRHRREMLAIRKAYNDQSANIVRTIETSNQIIKELHEKINEIETLGRKSPNTAHIRTKADELRNLVYGIDDLIVVQNIEVGLRLREETRLSSENDL